MNAENCNDSLKTRLQDSMKKGLLSAVKPNVRCSGLMALASFMFFSLPAFSQEFVSADKATTVVELYTSEGCSSCPPAEKWLSAYKTSPKLFKSVIPMAFHVDYWDYLGWKDRFADDDFSARQQLLRHQGIVSKVYTPEFVVNSKEWSKWFRGPRKLPESTTSPGELKLIIDDGQFQVDFETDKKLELNMAYLGMGLESNVTAGENNRRRLDHDFVVLKHWRVKANTKKGSGLGNWQDSLPPKPDFGQQETAIVAWLTEPRSLRIIQAVGGMLR